MLPSQKHNEQRPSCFYFWKLTHLPQGRMVHSTQSIFWCLSNSRQYIVAGQIKYVREGHESLIYKMSAVLQHGADKTDILGNLYIFSLSDSYVGQETHLHFTLALHVL